MNAKHYTKSTNGELKEDVLKQAQENHIWVNAFQTINPSDEILRQIGASVMRMLKDKQCTIPVYHGDDDDTPIHELQRLTGAVYLHVNAS